MSDVVASLVGMLLPPIAKFIGTREDVMNGLLWQAPLCAFAGFGALRLLLAPYLIYRQENIRAVQAEKKHGELAQKLMPTLEISRVDFGLTHPRKIINLRIFVRNGGPTTIRKVKVILDSINPSNAPQQLTLRHSMDTSPGKEKSSAGIDMPPGKEERFIIFNEIDRMWIIDSTMTGFGPAIACGDKEYKVQVTIYGDDVQPLTATIQVPVFNLEEMRSRVANDVFSLGFVNIIGHFSPL